MYQYYILEIQQYDSENYGHIIHFAGDADPDKAINKAYAKYYEVLSAAAVSELPMHSAVLVQANGMPVVYKSFTHSAEPAVDSEQ